MKVLKVFIITFLLWISTTLFVYSQNLPNITPYAEANGFVTYEVENVQEDTFVFTLFGDGTFSTNSSPTHTFKPNNRGYTTEAYFARAYDPNLPPKIVVQTGPISLGGNSSTTAPPNPSINMTGDIDLMTSWATAYGYENFYIIAFKNTESSTVAGSIEFLYNDKDILVDTSRVKIYNGWVSNTTPPTILNTPLYNRKLTWAFSNLASNETRYVYVPAETKTPLGEIINLEVKYNKTSDSKGSSTSHEFLSRKYPHDPNFIIVNKLCIKPELAVQQELIYTIGFFNDGEYFAENVSVKDELSNTLDRNSITLVNYEVAPVVSESNGTLYFDFENINLPGTNQTIPKVYSYDDAATYFSFKICTETNLSGDISNTASIIFDTQLPIYTNTSKISAELDCGNYDLCDNQALQKNQLQTQFTKEIKTDALVFEAYPNPTTNDLNVKIDFNLKEVSYFNIILLDYSGKVIKEFKENISSSVFTKTIDVKDISSGLYFMILETEHGRYTKKIIKN